MANEEYKRLGCGCGHLAAQASPRKCKDCDIPLPWVQGVKGGRPPDFCAQCKKRRASLKRLPLEAWERVCACCGAHFTTKQIRSKWCSPACGKRGRRIERPLKAESERAARRAAKLAAREANPMHGKQAAIRRLINVIKRLRQARQAEEKTSRPCATCGDPIGFGKRRKYCSKTCRDNGEVSKAIHRRVGSAYQAAKRARTVEAFDPIAVLERDKWRCQMCGVKTPRKLRGLCQPNSPEVDHIVPLAKQGDHVSWNAQCLCRRCNRAKSDKALGQTWLEGFA